MFETLARVIERALAIVFVLAITLNFVNVIGRYVFDTSILGADEIEVYTMVWITFLGAVVVTWRRQHLRMDVILRMLPAPVQTVLHAIELLLLAGLGGFMLIHSWNYAAQMYAIGRTSDMTDIPLWTIHAALPLGFGLIAAIGAWWLLSGMREPAQRTPGEAE
jgi:TRAP-type transport system small permease protein